MLKKIKDKIIEFNNDTYGMLITVSWIVLIICLVIKLFGGNWFELETENSKFIQFCIYVDNTMWLKMLLACIMNTISNYFIICLFLDKRKLNLIENIVFISLFVIKSIISWEFPVISVIMDVFILIILPMVFQKFKNWKRVIIFNVIILLLQMITIFVRNLSIINFNLDNTFLGQVLYQIDYYLLIILLYLYNIKKLRKEK